MPEFDLKLFRTDEREEPIAIIPMMSDIEGNAAASAAHILETRFTNARKDRYRPTVAILYRLDAGRRIAVRRFGRFADGVKPLSLAQ